VWNLIQTLDTQRAALRGAQQQVRRPVEIIPGKRCRLSQFKLARPQLISQFIQFHFPQEAERAQLGRAFGRADEHRIADHAYARLRLRGDLPNRRLQRHGGQIGVDLPTGIDPAIEHNGDPAVGRQPRQQGPQFHVGARHRDRLLEFAPEVAARAKLRPLTLLRRARRNEEQEGTEGTEKDTASRWPNAFLHSLAHGHPCLIHTAVMHGKRREH
jgi:hypothetical protein